MAAAKKSTTKRAAAKKSAAGAKKSAGVAKRSATKEGAAKPPRGSGGVRSTSKKKVVVEEEYPDEPEGTTSLVVVESPAKAKTIGKYLGRAYRVKATVGHIMDLPEKKLGIDIANGFEPELVPIPGKEKTIADLKSAAKDSKEVFIATDPDREGEAIAWHVAEEIKPKRGQRVVPVRRVLF